MRAASMAASKQSAGRLRRDDRHRRLAVAPVHRLQQVGLLGLGRQAGGRTAALDVADDQRQFERHRQPDRLALERDSRPRGGRHRQRTAEGGAQRGPDTGDLVLGLECANAEALVLGQLVQDVAGRGDRVGAEEQRQPGALRRRDQAVRQGEVAGDVAVGAGRQRGRLDLVGTANASVVSPKFQPARKAVMFASAMSGLLANFWRGTRVSPRPGASTSRTAGRGRTCSCCGRRPCGTSSVSLQRVQSELGQVHRVHLVAVQRAVLERVAGPAHSGQRARGEVVAVDDDRGARRHVVRLAFSAAGFIATSTSGRSPGVRMSWSAKCSWNDETPASVPGGARISAGSSAGSTGHCRTPLSPA